MSPRAALFRALRIAASALPLLLATPALAAWSTDPTVNTPLCTAAATQTFEVGVPDGAGGAIFVWTDLRTDSGDLYAQRVSAAGVMLWTANGIPVSAASNTQSPFSAVSDGAGGVLVAWTDNRGGAYDIYAQHLDGNGNALWTTNGVAVCTVTGDQSNPKIVSDGTGGALIAWRDFRSGTNWDYYARRVSAAGVPQWGASGVSICSAPGDQSDLVMVSDLAGGALMAWVDPRTSGGVFDVYAQHITNSGIYTLPSDGTRVTAGLGQAALPKAESDGAGGMLIVWEEVRYTTNTYTAYAQHVTSTLGFLWQSGGLPLSGPPGAPGFPTLCVEPNGGFFAIWRVNVGLDFYLVGQHVSTSGTPLWGSGGLTIASGPGDRRNTALTLDGTGGCIVSYTQSGSGMDYSDDIFAQRISSSGQLLWTNQGRMVFGASYNQVFSCIVPDGKGGAIMADTDLRAPGNAADLYCQRIDHYGQLGQAEPIIAGVRDVKNDQGGLVKVSWSASYLDADPTFGIFDYRLWRSVPSALAARQALARGATADADAAARDGSLLVTAAAPGYAWELAGSQPADALPNYSLVTATLSDSMPGSFPRTAFMIEARANNSIGTDRWYSAPDSGYSVDNLPPLAPAPFTGQYAAGQTRLHWNRNTESDLVGYRLYRGANTAFTPSPATFVADLPDTGYADPAGAPYVYKLRAVDVHGNESPVATLVPAGTLGVDAFAAPRAFLALASANPSRGTNTLQFGLAQTGRARLALYDATGRRVRTLVGGPLEAGDHSTQWDGRDDGGREVAAGLYFAKLEAGGNTCTVRIVRAN